MTTIAENPAQKAVAPKSIMLSRFEHLSSLFEKFVICIGFIVSSTAFLPLFESGGGYVETSFSMGFYICSSLIYLTIGILFLFRLNELWLLIKQNRILFAFLLFLCFSSAWALNRPGTLAAGLAAIMSTLLPCYAVARFRFEEWFKILAVAFAVILIGSVLTTQIFPNLGMHATGSWRGVFVNRNGLATYTAVSIPVFFILAVSFPRWRLASLFFLLLAAFVMYKTGSRTSLIALYIGIFQALALALIYRMRFSYAAITLLILLVLVPTLSWVGQEYTDQLTEAVGRKGDFSGRTESWEEVLEYGMDSPLLGFGDLNIDIVAPPHNMILAIWLKVGLVGVSFFVILYLFKYIDAANISRMFSWSSRYFYSFIFLFVLVRGLMEGLYFTTLLWQLLVIAMIAPRHYAAQDIWRVCPPSPDSKSVQK